MSAQRSRRGLRIGITIGLQVPNESLWTNGIKQNAMFLAKLFQHSPLGHDVRLLNTTDVPITDALAWDTKTFPTYAFADGADGADGMDVIIELGGQISSAQTERAQAAGGKIVSYCCGAEYVQFMQAMLFRRHISGAELFINQRYDALWMIPQVADTSRAYLETFRRRTAKIVPFVWDPMAIESACAGSENGGVYRPGRTAKRLTVIEPNIDISKFCLYPILAIEQAFRKRPELIDFVHVANAKSMVDDNREFAAMMRYLDLVTAGKISFTDRVDTPRFLAEHTDVVVSHQWGLPLNYFQLECCWLGYPLVHNCSLIKELGYAYSGNDISVAADQLLTALTSHDADWEGYRTRQRAGIDRFLTSNAALGAAYDDLLFDLFDNPGAAH